MMQQGMKPQMNIPLSKTTALVCEECGSEIFHEVLFVRKISKILIAAPQDALQPVGVFACVKCNHVNKEFELRGIDEEL
jgi:uncharacterized Zn finger protein